jgi:hypothetical protein
MQVGQKGQTDTEFYLLFLFCITNSLARRGNPSDRSDRWSVAFDVEKGSAGLLPEAKAKKPDMVLYF